MRRIAAEATYVFILVTAALALTYGSDELLAPTIPRGRDHDPALTAIARRLRPITSAIESFVAQHGRCPSLANAGDIADLKTRLPSGMAFEARRDALYIDLAIGYTQPDAEPQKCQIEIPVGWHDPSLVWWRDGAKSGWIFDPGDGTNSIPLQLNP